MTATDDEEDDEARTLRLKAIAEDADAVFARLETESPRGMVLIVAAHADNVLQELLEAGCGRDVPAEEKRRLLGQDAPLGTFGARILAAYVLGLLPEPLYRSLEQLRRARNHCAHHAMDVGFSEQKLRAHLMNIDISPLPAGFHKRGKDPVTQLAGITAMLMSWVSAAKPVLAGDNGLRANITRAWPPAPRG